MKFVFYANTDWYLFNFRLSTALELKAHGHDVVMLSPPGDFGARFAALGFRWVPLQMDRASLNPFREAATLRRLVRVLKDEKPDVLHNFTVKCAIYGALAGGCGHFIYPQHELVGSRTGPLVLPVRQLAWAQPGEAARLA